MTRNSKPVEVSILDTREEIKHLLRNNGLGVSINRLILQEILTLLQQEEALLVSRMKREWEQENSQEEQQEQ